MEPRDQLTTPRANGPSISKRITGNSYPSACFLLPPNKRQMLCQCFSKVILYFLKVLKQTHLSKDDRYSSSQATCFPFSSESWSSMRAAAWVKAGHQKRPSTPSSCTAASCTAWWTLLTSLWDSVRSMWRYVMR